MSGCARCDWQPDPEDPLAARLQLAAHADQADHPLCGVCSRSLTDTERRTCRRCIASTDETLAGIDLLYRELPDHRGHVRAQRYDADTPSAADGRPLPGGDILVLLGKGSLGLDEDGTTARDGDPTSVAYELGFWANTWAEARREGQVVDDAWSAKQQVRAALGYLRTMSTWAGQQHPGFKIYADDLHRLHRRLENATGRGDRPERAEAECFTCGADALVRKQTDRGLEDQWTCARCGSTYDWPRYLLACRARVEDGRQHLRAVGWGTIRQVAAAIGAAVPTVRKWAQRGLVTSCCLVDSQEQLVWYPDADLRARRARCRVQGHEPDPDPMVTKTLCLRCGAVLREQRAS